MNVQSIYLVFRGHNTSAVSTHVQQHVSTQATQETLQCVYSVPGLLLYCLLVTVLTIKHFTDDLNSCDSDVWTGIHFNHSGYHWALKRLPAGSYPQAPANKSHQGDVRRQIHQHAATIVPPQCFNWPWLALVMVEQPDQGSTRPGTPFTLKLKLLFPGNQISWVSEWLSDWLSTRFFPCSATEVATAMKFGTKVA